MVRSRVCIKGFGYSVGSKLISNRYLSCKLGLDPNWFLERTGIETRRQCDEAKHENVLSLGMAAVQRACADATLDIKELGSETIILHIQNGITHLTPPAGVVLAGNLGLKGVRVLSIDGVCTEPINAIELASFYLRENRCRRVIVSTSVDFDPIVDPNDVDTACLFGAGAGAIVIERNDSGDDRNFLEIAWEMEPQKWDLGVSEALGYERKEYGISINATYYRMDGKRLAKTALTALPRIVGDVLSRTGWGIDDVEFVIPHQPNAKLLELGIKFLGVEPQRVAQYAKEYGNMGPASLLVAFARAKHDGLFDVGSKGLLISFGLGFSCAAMSLIV